MHSGPLLTEDFRDHEAALSDFIESKISLKLRMRLECSLHDREGKPLTRDGQTTGKYFGHADQADFKENVRS